MRVKRYPFYLETPVFGIKYCSYFISNDPLVSSHFHLFKEGIDSYLRDFILEHCKCKYCALNIATDFSQCICGEAETNDKYLAAVFPTEKYHLHSIILERESRRIKVRKRNEKLKMATNKNYTKRDVELLHEVQEGRCYYCSVSFSDLKTARHHIDHYFSVKDGGDNSFNNIVLSCPECNFDKGALNGDSYQLIRRRTLSKKQKQTLAVIRRKVKKLKGNMLVNEVLVKK